MSGDFALRKDSYTSKFSIFCNKWHPGILEISAPLETAIETQFHVGHGFVLIFPIIFLKNSSDNLQQPTTSDKQQQLFIALIAPYEKAYFWLNLVWFHINCDRPCEVVLNIYQILILTTNRNTVSQSNKHFEQTYYLSQ